MRSEFRVGDIATLRRTAVVVDPADEYREIGLRSFGKGVFHKEPVTGATLGTKRVFEIQPGDLVLSNVFAREGAIGLASEAETGYIGSHRFMTYVVDPEVADANYLRYYFLSDHGLEQVRRASPGSAGRNRTLGIDAFEAIRVSLPPVGEQRDVAARLDHVGSVSSEVRRRATVADRVSSAIPASLTHRYDLTEKEKRARGWRRLLLSDVLSVERDEYRVEADRSYPNVGILSFGRGLFEKPPVDGTATSANTLYRIRSGQFIYSRLFAFEGAYAAVTDQFDGYYVSNEFPTFDVDETAVDARFLASYFRSRSVWEELGRSSRGLGSRRQRVHPEAVLAFEVTLPPVDEQRRVVEKLEGVAESSDRRQRSLEILSALESSSLNSLVGRPQGERPGE